MEEEELAAAAVCQTVIVELLGVRQQASSAPLAYVVHQQYWIEYWLRVRGLVKAEKRADYLQRRAKQAAM